MTDSLRSAALPSHTRAGSAPRKSRILGAGALALAVLVGAPSLVAGAAGQKTDPAGTQAPAGASEKGRGTRTGSEWFDRGMELHESERWDAAIDAFRKALEAGYREEVAAYNIACAQARKGEKDLAFEWLDKAMQGGFDVYGHLDDSDLDGLHSDPRWTELKRKAREARAGRDQAKVRRAAERFDLLVDPDPEGRPRPLRRRPRAPQVPPTTTGRPAPSSPRPRQGSERDVPLQRRLRPRAREPEAGGARPPPACPRRRIRRPRPPSRGRRPRQPSRRAALPAARD
ncbi:MAG: hypothetical protein IPL90_13800 [Holophagales bacterium]|nr:hypothetical protein [Holophagales bacterium]